MIYGYVRVSSKDQNLARQLETMKNYKNVDKVFCDKQSGKNFDREAYQQMKEILVPGDEVMVKSLDRLGRNKEQTKEEIKWYKENGIVLRILNLPTSLIDYQGQEWIMEMVNNILIEVLASYAEQERIEIGLRQKEGIAAMPIVNGKRISTKTGNEYGRPVIKLHGDFEKFLKKQKDGELTVAECCEQLGISRATWYNKVREVS